MMIIRIAVRCPIMLICAWALTFTISPKLALIFLIVIPILALGLFLIMTNAHPIFERVFKKYDWLNNVVQENLLGIRVVKSFVREDHERAKFGNVSNEIFTDFTRAEKLISFNAPLMQLCVYGCMLTVSWVGAHLVVGRRDHHRQPDQHVQLHHDDPHEPDDVLHGAGADHPGPRLRRAYL